MDQHARWKGIVFDFDGTLLDSVHEGRKRFIRIANGLGLPMTEMMHAEIRRLWGVPALAMIETCWPETCVKTFVDAWEEFDCVNQIALFPGVEEIISLLSTQALLSILTMRHHSTHAQLRSHGMADKFHFIYTLDDCPASKPDPRSIERLLAEYKHHGVEMSDLLLIGDSVHADYGLALATGMDFIAVTWGNNSREDFLVAGLHEDWIIDTIEHLPRILIP